MWCTSAPNTVLPAAAQRRQSGSAARTTSASLAQPGPYEYGFTLSLARCCARLQSGQRPFVAPGIRAPQPGHALPGRVATHHTLTCYSSIRLHAIPRPSSLYTNHKCVTTVTTISLYIVPRNALVPCGSRVPGEFARKVIYKNVVTCCHKHM